MTKLYIVYITYYNTVENLFAFTDKADAQAKRLELAVHWVNEDQFTEYCKENDLNHHIADIANYDNYWMEVEDDAYVGMDQVILNEG